MTDREHPLPPGAKPLVELPDLSPEARRKEALRWRAGLQDRAYQRFGPGSRFLEIVKRVAIGAWNDGFIHAGNLAYMAILSLFPFFITVAALFSIIGEESQRAASINAFLLAVPPVVANVIEPVARGVIESRSGWLLWIGGVVGLWTVGSLVETIRDILRRAYGTHWEHAFWRYRLASTGVIFAAVVLLLVSLAVQVVIGTAQEVIGAWFPQLVDLIDQLALSRFIPALGLYLSLYLLFLSLTPGAYRKRRYPKWPGALLVTVWWVGVTIALPAVLRSFFSYDLTYGSLAGIMIALFFFWLVGLGMVVGAELNAALTVTPEERDMMDPADKRKQAQGGFKQTSDDGEATA
ncbi:MAG: YihY/virulence factor BrkB family protein [Novosphingobium sp.]|nr:YihY/virulence factor BrkB family protein [Novosphingobium sp.]